MKRTKTDNSYVINYDLNDNYPLIPNQNTYFEQDKMICINSQDRNVTKYPESSSFEILLPRDIVNVSAIQLQNWMIPIQTNSFSYSKNNLKLEFALMSPTYSLKSINSSETNNISEKYILLLEDILTENNIFTITINEGTYTAITLANELQNQMNVIVNNAIINHITDKTKDDYIPYTFFNVIVSNIKNKFWFVNTLNSFTFTNSKIYKTDALIGEVFNPCSIDKMFTSYIYYGLPAYLGFRELPASSRVCHDIYDLTVMSNSYTINTTQEITVNNIGSNSYVTLPVPSFQQNIVGNKYVDINYIKPEYSYTLVLYTHIYLELETLNCGDQTQPFTQNEFTRVTNQGNGSVNSFLGRIPLFSTGDSDYATSNGGSEKQTTSYFNPPLERLRKLKINLRYHDGTNVDFGLNSWDFALKVTSYLPTQNKKITTTPF